MLLCRTRGSHEVKPHSPGAKRSPGTFRRRASGSAAGSEAAYLSTVIRFVVRFVPCEARSR